MSQREEKTGLPWVVPKFQFGDYDYSWNLDLSPNLLTTTTIKDDEVAHYDIHIWYIFYLFLIYN
jgi:hypothetical protein